MNNRYVAERERGSDWCVVDTRLKGRPVCVTGLEQEEAEQTAKEWNDGLEKQKNNFV